MKKALILCCLLFLTACTKAVQEKMMCTLTLQTELSDGRVPVSITVDPALPGNRFRNLNTGQSYPFPTFVNNSGVLEVLKGVYVVSFDGDALFQDGSHATVRIMNLDIGGGTTDFSIIEYSQIQIVVNIL